MASYQDTPLPADEADVSPIFQAWHEFDDANERWGPLDAARATSSFGDRRKTSDRDSQSLVLVTWNVNYSLPTPKLRTSAIVSLTPAVDIIFLQEVTRAALFVILNDARIRQHWFSSEANAANWGGHLYKSMMLLSNTRFAYPKGSSEQATLGPVWRVKYPSRFGRDAICCDIFVPLSPPASATLINVYLDSLPSLRQPLAVLDKSQSLPPYSAVRAVV